MKISLNEAMLLDDVRRSVALRFYAKVEMRGNSDCWLWKSKAKHMFGYGAFTVSKGVVSTSHRVAWALANGPIPDGGFVLHRCDVPACCNPRHLYIGDSRDNMDDKMARGRVSRTKHSPETIEKIRISRARNQKKQSAAARKARSDAMKKRWQDPAWRERFTALNSGPNNHRFGKRPPEHQLEAVRRGHRRGFKHTEETKEKMRAAALNRRREAQ